MVRIIRWCKITRKRNFSKTFYTQNDKSIRKCTARKQSVVPQGTNEPEPGCEASGPPVQQEDALMSSMAFQSGLWEHRAAYGHSGACSSHHCQNPAASQAFVGLHDSSCSPVNQGCKMPRKFQPKDLGHVLLEKQEFRSGDLYFSTQGHAESNVPGYGWFYILNYGQITNVSPLHWI